MSVTGQSNRRLRWGILGTGNIAGKFARALPASRTGVVQAVASRDTEKALAFAKTYGAAAAYGSYDELLADENVDVVYITAPHPWHAQWCIAAAGAGKHILCEKPMTMTAAEARRVIDEVRKAKVFFMEAFMYRCHEQNRRAIQLIHDGAIGKVQFIRASYGSAIPRDEGKRFLNKSLGGGGILDIGCYTTSTVRQIAGAAVGADFAEPTEIQATGKIGTTGVDEFALATMRFDSGIIAQIACSICVHMDKLVQVFGSEGLMTIPLPWRPAPDGGKSQILIQKISPWGTAQPEGGQWGFCAPQEIVVEDPRPIWAIEADSVAENIANFQSPDMTWADSLGNMETLDRWRKAIGLEYPADKNAAF